MKIARSARKKTATVIWIAIAVMLIYRGINGNWANIDSTTSRVLALVAAAILGGGKGIFVIAKSARRTAAYINSRPEQDWIWLSLRPILYFLVPLMIGMGWTLRHFCAESYPALVLAVYVGVGAALLTGIRGFFAPDQSPA